jgi:Spy/CpxP family protein refolding chaperone
MFEQVSDLPREEQREKMQELMKVAQKKVKDAVGEILLPHQAERLKQLSVQFQMRGGSGLTSSEDVAEQLNITPEQRDKLREKARELEQELRKKLLADLLKELTPEQQAKYKELVGEPFEFQQDERFGRGGFGGPGGGGPGGPGGPGGGGPGGGGGRRGN